MASKKAPLEMTIPEYRQYLREHGFPEETGTDSQIAALRDFLDQFCNLVVDNYIEQNKKRKATPDQEKPKNIE